MRRKHNKPITINQTIMDTVRNKKPETVEQLIELVQKKLASERTLTPLPEKEIMKHILNLQNKGKLAFREQVLLPLTYKAYIFSAKAAWYWAIITLAIATTTAVFTIPENAFPIVYARYVLGSLSFLFLPGYSLIKALFPTKVPIPTGKKELDNIERLALSLGMSIALVPLTGLLLNYTPWGIRTTPVTLSLLALTTTLATAALIREHQALIHEID